MIHFLSLTKQGYTYADINRSDLLFNHIQNYNHFYLRILIDS